MAVLVVGTFPSVCLHFSVTLIYQGFEPGRPRNSRQTCRPRTDHVLFYVRLSLVKMSLHILCFLSLDGPGEGKDFNALRSVEDCKDLNNANCDSGVMGDSNSTEYLNQTTEPPVLVNKAREDEEFDGEKGGVTEETEDDTDRDDDDKGKKDN